MKIAQFFHCDSHAGNEGKKGIKHRRRRRNLNNEDVTINHQVEAGSDYSTVTGEMISSEGRDSELHNKEKINKNINQTKKLELSKTRKARGSK